jgi:NADH-quinone oxidoreductase subunit E
MLGMLKAMRTTLRHLPTKKITVQYPEQRETLPERSRGLFSVVVDPQTGAPSCRSCTLCETNCPVQVIRVEHSSKYDLPAPNVARISRARLGAQPGIDLQLLRPVLDDYLERGTGLIGILQNTQDVYGFLPRVAIHEIALQTGMSLSQIYGVVSFYNQFRLSAVGKHIITVCHGTACHVAGAPLITAAFSEVLGVEVGRTTKDGIFTLEAVSCVGACALAPVVRVGESETLGRMTPDKARKVVVDLRRQEGAE